LQSDLANDVIQLKAFQAQNSIYPTSVTDCPTPSNPSITICLKNSPGNSIVGYSANPNPSSPSFYLVNQNGNSAYSITDTTKPKLANTTQPNVTPGAILELHAARANNGLSQGINSPLTTTWKDTSGNGNDGTLTNFGAETPWGGAGTAGDPYKLTFDGVDDIVYLPLLNNVYQSKSLTAEVWASVNYHTGSNYGIFSTHNSNYTNAFDLRWEGGKVSLHYYIASTDNLVTTSVHIVDDGLLHHIVGTADGSYLRLYIDGSLVGNPVALSVGAVAAMTTHYVGSDGWLNKIAHTTSSVRIYPFALTATQVAANYAAGVTW